ncbi:MAG: aspartate/glutamate racemase family protein, partial [Saprospiraceae bacterium]
TPSSHVGVLATPGTVQSRSYVLEINHFFPEIQVFQQACPMWVPLIENNEHDGPGADYFVEKYVGELLAQSGRIDAVILGCTHYPLMLHKIRRIVPAPIRVLAQGDIVAERLADYLARHPEMESQCRKTGQRAFFTTETPEVFDTKASLFYGQEVCSRHFEL